MRNRWAPATLVGVAFLVMIVGCKSSTVEPIKDGKVIGKSHQNSWIETVAIPDDSEPGAVRYQQEPHDECWRISFTSNGQIAYTCVPKPVWDELTPGESSYDGSYNG